MYLVGCCFFSLVYGCDSSGRSMDVDEPNADGEIQSADGFLPFDGRLIERDDGAIDSGLSQLQPSFDARQAQFYDRDEIQTIEITIEPSDRQRMFAALPERIYVPARFRWNDIQIDNVGIRFKGNSSSNPDGWWKRSLLVKFGEFVDGQRFLGLRRVALDNAAVQLVL